MARSEEAGEQCDPFKLAFAGETQRLKSLLETQLNDVQRRDLLQGNTRDVRGRTLLQTAVFRRQHATAQMLCQMGASIKPKTIAGMKFDGNSTVLNRGASRKN